MSYAQKVDSTTRSRSFRTLDPIDASRWGQEADRYILNQAYEVRKYLVEPHHRAQSEE